MQNFFKQLEPPQLFIFGRLLCCLYSFGKQLQALTRTIQRSVVSCFCSTPKSEATLKGKEIVSFSKLNTPPKTPRPLPELPESEDKLASLLQECESLVRKGESASGGGSSITLEEIEQGIPRKPFPRDKETPKLLSQATAKVDDLISQIELLGKNDSSRELANDIPPPPPPPEPDFFKHAAKTKVREKQLQTHSNTESRLKTEIRKKQSVNEELAQQLQQRRGQVGFEENSEPDVELDEAVWKELEREKEVKIAPGDNFSCSRELDLIGEAMKGKFEFLQRKFGELPETQESMENSDEWEL